jgi:predicted nucleotidyltransferase
VDSFWIKSGLNFYQEVTMQMPAEVPTEVLDELVRRLVAAVQPTRIILFGSAARGEMHEDSDLDVLVVVPDDRPHRATWNQAYKSLSRLGYPKDILVVSESILDQYAGSPGLIYAQVIQEGREIYHAA